MRTTFMEDAQRWFGDEEEFQRLYGIMGNIEIEPNGKIDREYLVYKAANMRSLQRKVQSYRDDN
jgi:hypothetical protein